jgi:membrane protease YdiL (CAAX protease family)
MKNEHHSYPSLPQAWVIFAIFLAASIGTGLLMVVINELAGIENLSIGNFFAYNISMLFVIWFAWRNRVPKLDRISKNDRILYFGAVPTILYPLLILLTLSFSVALDPLTNLIPMPEFMEELFALLATRDVWTFTMVGITGPILEEILFRGIILDGFLTRYRPGKAIFWSAFLFGLFHLNPWQFIPGFLMGLLLGYIYLKTRSLIPVILVHIVNNSFSYIIMYFYGADVVSFRDLFAEAVPYHLFLAASSAIFAVSLILLYRLLHKSSDAWTFSLKTDSSS